MRNEDTPFTKILFCNVKRAPHAAVLWKPHLYLSQVVTHSLHPFAALLLSIAPFAQHIVQTPFLCDLLSFYHRPCWLLGMSLEQVSV